MAEPAQIYEIPRRLWTSLSDPRFVERDRS
jgi:hypothetical protein